MSKKKSTKKNNNKKENPFFNKIKEKIVNYCSLHFIKKSQILPLSPRIIKDEYINEYLKKLHTAIKNKDIYNISVTGNYGTGKSSIIKTYLNKYHISEKNYIIINIASYFDYEETINSTLPSEEEKNKTSQNSDKEGSLFSNTADIQEEVEKQNQKEQLQEGKLAKERKDVKEKYQLRKLDKNEIKLVDNIEAAILRQILFRNSAEELKGSNIKRVSSKCRRVCQEKCVSN